MTTPLIGEFEGRRISRMLARLNVGHLRPGEQIAVSGEESDGWVHLIFELTGGATQYRVEARLDCKRNKIRPADAKEMLLDLLGHLFTAYLKAPREPFTGPKWEEIEYDGRPVFLRGQERADEAEGAATEMLRLDAKRRSRQAAAETSGEQES